MSAAIGRREVLKVSAAAGGLAALPAPSPMTDEEWDLLRLTAGPHTAEQAAFRPDSPAIVLIERLRERGFVRYVVLGCDIRASDGSWIDSYYTATDLGRQALTEHDAS